MWCNRKHCASTHSAFFLPDVDDTNSASNSSRGSGGGESAKQGSFEIFNPETDDLDSDEDEDNSDDDDNDGAVGKDELEEEEEVSKKESTTTTSSSSSPESNDSVESVVSARTDTTDNTLHPTVKGPLLNLAGLSNTTAWP